MGNIGREFEYTVKRKITEGDLKDLIIDGIETGTNYWMFIHNDTEQFEQCYDKDLCTSEAIAEILLNGGAVEVSDVEDKTTKYSLTLDKLIEGIQKNAEERPHDCDLENYDAITTDCIFQYGIFGEIVFG